MSCSHLQRQFRVTLAPPHSNSLSAITTAMEEGTKTIQRMTAHCHGYLEYINPDRERIMHWRCCPFPQRYLALIERKMQVIQVVNENYPRGQHIREERDNGFRA